MVTLVISLLLMGFGELSLVGYPVKMLDVRPVDVRYGSFPIRVEFMDRFTKGEIFLNGNPKSGFDSLNVRFVGAWPYGLDYAVCSNRDTVFTGSGQVVIIIDLSDPSNPVKIGEMGTRGVVYGLFYQGGYLYIADGSGGLEYGMWVEHLTGSASISLQVMQVMYM